LGAWFRVYCNGVLEFEREAALRRAGLGKKRLVALQNYLPREFFNFHRSKARFRFARAGLGEKPLVALQNHLGLETKREGACP